MINLVQTKTFIQNAVNNNNLSLRITHDCRKSKNFELIENQR